MMPFAAQQPFSPGNSAHTAFPAIPPFLQELGVTPEVAAQMMAGVQGLPPDQQVQALRNQVLQVPGVREKLMAQTQPLNQGAQPVPPAPAGPPSTPPAIGQPTNPGGGQGGEPGANPNRFKGRLAHGKGLPPGQLKKQGNAAVSGPAPTPRPAGPAGSAGGTTGPVSLGGVPAGGMTSVTGPGLQAEPQPAPAPRPIAAGGGGMSGEPFNQYRQKRLGSPRVVR